MPWAEVQELFDELLEEPVSAVAFKRARVGLQQLQQEESMQQRIPQLREEPPPAPSLDDRLAPRRRPAVASTVAVAPTVTHLAPGVVLTESAFLSSAHDVLEVTYSSLVDALDGDVASDTVLAGKGITLVPSAPPVSDAVRVTKGGVPSGFAYVAHPRSTGGHQFQVTTQILTMKNNTPWRPWVRSPRVGALLRAATSDKRCVLQVVAM
tara:strand:- start:212 stop:838 length:627 start_codon:yes stop_codon:yes gene_type:complete